MTLRVQDTVVRVTAEGSIAVVQEGTNNVARGRSEEVLGQYRALIRKLKESRREGVVAGLRPE